MSGSDDRRPDVDPGHDAEEREQPDSGQADTAHEDTVPFDKESRLDEPHPGE